MENKHQSPYDIINKLSPSICWKVGLYYGSMIYFEMHEKLLQKRRDGSYGLIGSSTLSIDSDNWTIYESTLEIINSNDVSRNFSESVLNENFLDKRCMNVKLKEKMKYLYCSQEIYL